MTSDLPLGALVRWIGVLVDVVGVEGVGGRGWVCGCCVVWCGGGVGGGGGGAPPPPPRVLNLVSG